MQPRRSKEGRRRVANPRHTLLAVRQGRVQLFVQPGGQRQEHARLPRRRGTGLSLRQCRRRAVREALLRRRSQQRARMVYPLARTGHLQVHRRTHRLQPVRRHKAGPQLRVPIQALLDTRGGGVRRCRQRLDHKQLSDTAGRTVRVLRVL